MFYSKTSVFKVLLKYTALTSKYQNSTPIARRRDFGNFKSETLAHFRRNFTRC